WVHGWRRQTCAPRYPRSLRRSRSDRLEGSEVHRGHRPGRGAQRGIELGGRPGPVLEDVTGTHPGTDALVTEPQRAEVGDVQGEFRRALSGAQRAAPLRRAPVPGAGVLREVLVTDPQVQVEVGRVATVCHGPRQVRDPQPEVVTDAAAVRPLRRLP